MKFDDFLDLAKRLKDAEGAKEVEFRSSISRAYNYAFVLIKTRHRNDKRVTFSGREGDKGLVGQLLTYAKKRDLASQWRAFSSDRNSAEYDMDEKFEKDFADEFVDDIESFITELRNKVRVKVR